MRASRGRHCLRCGKTNARTVVERAHGHGWIHARCRTAAERLEAAQAGRERASRRREAEARDRADAEAQFAADKARYFPEPAEDLRE